MARIFNSIRQRLLAQNRLTRYLVYAIGEIVLVVVGILIALQINEVKDQRGRNAQERGILIEMFSNLQMDSLDMTGNIERNMKVLNGAKAVLRQLDERTAWNDTMSYHYGQLANGSLVAPVLSSYENLKSVGFDLIRNDSLRAMIHKLYAQQYPFVVRIEQEHGEAMRYSVIVPQLLKNIDSSPKDGSRPVDLDALRDDHQFKEAVRSTIKAQGQLIYFYNRLLKLNLQLMRMIEQELEKGR